MKDDWIKNSTRVSISFNQFGHKTQRIRPLITKKSDNEVATYLAPCGPPEMKKRAIRKNL